MAGPYPTTQAREQPVIYSHNQKPMITKVNSLGLELAYETPNTAEEFDQLAGVEGSCVSEATSNILYRSTLTTFRNLFCEKLAEETGIDRLTKVTGTKKNSEGEEEEVVAWDESEAVFVKRVCAEKGVEVIAFRHIADDIISSEDGKFDPKRQERMSAGPKKPAKMYLTLAEKIIAAGKGELRAAELAEKLGIPVDGTDSTSIARAISENERRKRQDLTEDYL